MSVLAEGSQLSCPKCGASLQRSGDLAGQCFVCLLGLALEETAVQTADLKRFDHYEIATNADGSPVVLGRGAMGTTFKAVDTILKNDVALKVIDASLAAHPEARERFLREARAAAGLRHPNVASVFYYGVRDTDGHCFYAMELVEGETLESRLRRSGPLDIGSVLEVASQVALALVAAEARGLVHRDLKPANLMLLKGPQPTVKVIDFGLSKAAAASANDPNLTYGGFVGTAAFASPEQCTGATVDSRSDLYSLGVTLWELLTGQVPFRGSPSEVMYQHQHAALPLDLLKEVPKQVVVLLEVLLAKDKACRFQTPTEFLKVIPMVREAVRTGRRIRKTVRVFVSSTGDVQKERNLAESVMRSVAADFNLAVIESYSNSQRLEEANGELEEELEDHEKLILCPYFWPYQGLEADVREPIPDITQFDMIICILWSRLGVLADPAFRMPNGDPAGPGGIPSSHIYHNCSKPTPPLEPKEERELFGRQWDAVQQFFAQSEKNSQGNFAGRLTNYHNLEEFEELFREHFRNILASRIGREVGQKILSPKVPRWKSSPFRGLNIFGFEHAPIFHGRTKAIGEVLEALDEQFRAQRPFLLIVGASGSGKSSLVQAGVLPLLTQPETIEGIGLWRWAVTRPGAGGSGGDCFDALAGALLEPHALPTLQDPESTDAIHNLASELRGHSDTVALRIRDALDYAAREWKIRHFRDLEKKECQLRDSQRLDEANSAQEQKQRLLQPKARLALVVDQLEELFTSGFSTDVRQKYISVVSGLVRSGRVTILATLRSDFYPSYQEFPDLIELTKPAGKFDLRPPTRHEIGNLIRLPAEAAGLRFEQQETGQRLDETLCDAASATPGSLPLLEHVLSLLYEKQAARGDDSLRWSDYFELGELKGALAQHAEAIFDTLQPAEQKAFPLVMRHLVALGQGEEEVPSKRTVAYRDFVSERGSDRYDLVGAKGFVDLFIEKRLLVADADPQGEVTVCVAHEALLREWQRVKSWLVENREFLRMRDRLDASLKLWLSRGKQRDDLLGPGLPLAEAEKLSKDFGSSLSRDQSSYVYASISERKRRKRVQQRIRYAVMGSICVLAIAAGFQWLRAERQRQSAEKSAERAQQNEARSQDLLREASKVDFVTAMEQKEPAAKLAYLARAVRQDPSNQVACISLEQLITQEGSFPRAPVSSVRHEGSLLSACFNSSGNWVVTASADHTARVWEASTGKAVGQPMRHSGKVNSAVFSPDGKWVLTASDDGTARLWDAASGQEMNEPLQHDGRVNSAVFSPDGKWILTASDDGTARRWDVASGRQLGQPLRHDGFIYSAEISPDGNLVVTTSSDQTARLWEAKSGRPVGGPLRHDKDVWHAAFSPDGKLVVTASSDHTARLWESASGTSVGQPLRHNARVDTAVFSPDGKWVVTASEDHTGQVWEAATGKPVGEPMRHDKNVNSAVFSPDGKWVVTASVDGTAQIWEAATGKARGEPMLHDGNVSGASFSPGGAWVVTASDDRTARVWKALSGKAVSESLRHDDKVSDAEFSPDGKWIVSGSDDRTTRVWEAVSGKAVSEPLRQDDRINVAVFSPDGKRVVTASSDRTARIWEAATGKSLGLPLRHNGGISSVAFSPYGNWVVTASWDGTAQVWEVATGKSVGQPLQHEGAVNTAAFSPDGKWVVTASADRRAQIWQAATGKPAGYPMQHDGYVWEARFSPDGKLAVTASADGTACIWEAATGKRVGQSMGHEGGVKSASFSRDGKWIITASVDGTGRVWESATGKEVGEPLRHSGPVNSASFSPDGKWALTASADHTARVWEAMTGKPVGEPLQHDNEVRHAVFSPDGKWIVTASSDCTARLWEAPLEEHFSEGLMNIVKLLPQSIGHLDFDTNGFLKNVPNFRVIECRNQISTALQEPGVRGSSLAARIEWSLADERTRSINPTARLTVPDFILAAISWYRNLSNRGSDPMTMQNKGTLEEAYSLDPAFPLIHLALAGLETNPERAAFLREFDLKRLPDSCKYTVVLDPAEITLEAAEMCGEQKDWPRVLLTLDKYVKIGKSNSRSETLRRQAQSSQSLKTN